MYQAESTIEIDKTFILKEDEATYRSRFSSELPIAKSAKNCSLLQKGLF